MMGGLFYYDLMMRIAVALLPEHIYPRAILSTLKHDVSMLVVRHGLPPSGVVHLQG